MSTLVGMQLSGRYRLDAQIGAGGMSTVYRAFDVDLERRVAIKLMHREIAADSDQLERFRREARAVAQLSHPHIVGRDRRRRGGRAGRTSSSSTSRARRSRTRIRRMGRLPVDEALAYAIEIARALGCAHAHDIVHRDIKPQNVLIDAEGSAKVTDFGIARSLQRRRPDRRRPRARHDRLRLPRAGARPRRRRPVGHLLARRRALRDAHRRRPVPRREPDLGRDEARARGPAGHPAAPARGLGHARRGARPDDREGPRPPLPGRRRRWSPTSRRRWRSRPPARAPRPARRPRSLRTLPARARRRLPLRHAPPGPAAGRRSSLLAVGAGVIAAAGQGGRRPHAARHRAGHASSPTPRHAGRLGRARLRARLRPARRRRGALRPRRSRAVDRDPGTAWTHRVLRRRHHQGRGKPPASGIYVDAKPRSTPSQMQIADAEAGLEGDDLRRARRRRCPKSITGGWTKVGGGTVDEQATSASSSTRAARPTATTSSGSPSSPPGARAREISEIRAVRAEGRDA